MKTTLGPWRIDPLDPRIVFDGKDEFFAVAASAAAARQIVEALQALEPRPATAPTPRERESESH